MMQKMEGNFKSKKVILRCDFNVPFQKNGEGIRILDDFRIRQVLSTIKYLIKRKAKIILISHFADNLSLKPIARELEKLSGKKIRFLEDCLAKKTKKEIEKIKPGGLVLLGNLRLHKEEEKNDPKFAKALASLGDIYINEAFSVCHRTHASVVGITKYLPSFPGFLLEREVKTLTSLLKSPQKPMIALVGGKKVETKAKLIDKISQISDFVLIGGLIARELKQKKIKLKFPSKIIEPLDERGNGKDIGPRTINLFKQKISSAKTIFWTGPLGKVEKKMFEKGTLAIAKTITRKRVFSVVGGGETVWFLGKNNLIGKFSHVSTGGGAMLAYLSGEKLPGLEALKHNACLWKLKI